MKYLADTPDKAVFESETHCMEHERLYAAEMAIRDQVKAYLDLQEWPKDPKVAKRERTKAERWLHGWLAHDIRQRGERYGVDLEEVDEPAVRAVTGAC